MTTDDAVGMNTGIGLGSTWQRGGGVEKGGGGVVGAVSDCFFAKAKSQFIVVNLM